MITHTHTNGALLQLLQEEKVSLKCFNKVFWFPCRASIIPALSEDRLGRTMGSLVLIIVKTVFFQVAP